MSIDLLQKNIRRLKCPAVLNFDIPSIFIPPQIFQAEGSFLPAYARYSIEMLEALRDQIPAVRFSLTAMAMYGSDGLMMLSRLLHIARELGYYVFLDIPDALSSFRAQENARLLFSETCPLEFHGVVVSSYIGSDGIKPFAAAVENSDKDLFVLLRSANKSAAELQDLLTGSRLAHHALADKVARYGKPLISRSGYSKIGAVGAANAASVLSNLRKRFPNMFLLLDGGDLPNAFSNSCAAAFDEFGHGAIINIGDSVLGAWYTEELDPRDYVMGARHQVELFCKKMKNHVCIL